MRKKCKEWLSVQVSKRPSRVVLISILVFNVLFIILAASVISSFSLDGTESMDFLQAAFCTITMILDAGCVQFVISDIGQGGVFVSLLCLVIIFIGMISFTGAVIGYVTNYISDFIESASSNSRKLHITRHIVILNWNTRASEIVNDLLYCAKRQRVVILVESGKASIEKEIEERLNDTISRENIALKTSGSRKKMRNNITYIVREGNVYSTKQLRDISLERAKTVIILGSETKDSVCRFEQNDFMEAKGRGNAQTIKTLMQVADITAAAYSDDDQKIVVEITDDWTWNLANKIVKSKQNDEKCNIVLVRINTILGQLLSQFSVMPELNRVYSELFSNKGATFYSVGYHQKEEDAFVRDQFNSNCSSIPLTVAESGGKPYAYFVADSMSDITPAKVCRQSELTVDVNHDYTMLPKNVIILGHNSKSRNIMEGFADFRKEWNFKDCSRDILSIVVIDDEKSLEKMNYYRDFPFVQKTVAADIYEREIICDTIDGYLSSSDEKISVLILSNDAAPESETDSNALANLIYVQDIVNGKKENDPDFDSRKIDIIVEINDPKHHDIVNNYSVKNVVISNRYISKLITQIGEEDSLFTFYTDILTYDSDDAEVYESKEVYIKEVI